MTHPSARSTEAAEPRFVVAFHPCIVGRRSMPWRDTLELAEQTGYGAVEVDLGELLRSRDPDPAGTLAGAGLVAGTATLPVEFRGEEDRFRADLGAFPALAELAARAGVRTLTSSIPASSQVPPDELRPLLQRRLTEVVRRAEGHGLRIALEGLGPLHLRVACPHTFVWRLADVAEFARSCGCGVLVDSWHWHHAGDTADDITNLGPDLLAVHVADAADQPAAEVRDAQRKVPGDGVIDWAAFVGAVGAANSIATVTAEVFDDRSAADADPINRAHAVQAATNRLLRRTYG